MAFNTQELLRGAVAKAAPVTEPEILNKAGVAALCLCSQRQIENLVRAGRLPQPHYLGCRSPRWIRSEVLQALTAGRSVAGSQR